MTDFTPDAARLVNRYQQWLADSQLALASAEDNLAQAQAALELQVATQEQIATLNSQVEALTVTNAQLQARLEESMQSMDEMKRLNSPAHLHRNDNPDIIVLNDDQVSSSAQE